MRINVEHSALDDPRFKRLARALRRPHRLVLGEMLFLWEHCYTARSPYIDSDTLDGLMECDGYAVAMLADGDESLALAEEVPAGHPVEDPKGRAVHNPAGRATRLLRIRGVMDRIEYLLDQDHKRDLAAEAKRKKRDNERPAGHPAATAKARPARAASESGSESESGTQSIYTGAKGTDLGLPVVSDAMVSALPRAADWRAHKGEVMRAIVGLHCERFNALRDELRLDVPAMGVGDPAERALSALLETSVDLAASEAKCRHVLAVREKEARELGHVQFFGAIVWKPEQFDRASTTQLKDVGRPRQITPRQQAAGEPAHYSPRKIGPRQ